MPRFFFHLFNNVNARDEEGLELPDAATAIQEAIKNARAMAAQSVCDGSLNLDHRIEIEDERGETIGTVHFRDVVSVEGCR